VLYLGKHLNESEFKWEDSESQTVIVAAHIGTESVCSKCIVEFDLTPLLTQKYATDETSENRLKLTFRDLTRFQIRLRTEQAAWVKLASKEYHDATKRPIIIFSQVAWMDYFKPILTVFWTIYYLLIPPLKVPIFGACLAAFIHKTRKYTWPIINFIVMRFLSSSSSSPSLGKNISINTALCSTPSSPLSTPKLLIDNNIENNKEIDSGLEKGFLNLRSSMSARSLPTLLSQNPQIHDDIIAGLRRSRHHE